MWLVVEWGGNGGCLLGIGACVGGGEMEGVDWIETIDE